MEKKKELNHIKVALLLTVAVLTTVFSGCKSRSTNDSPTSRIDTATLEPINAQAPLNVGQWDLDSVFQQWNLSTMRFLDTALKSADSEKTKAFEFSRAAVLRMKSNEKLSNESARKTFLVALKADSILLPKEYFLIETFLEGETTRAITYLAMVHGNALDIHKYSREEGEIQRWKWVSYSATSQKNRISQPLSAYEVQSKDGINEDLVIITHFNNNNADETFFFQRQSLSPNIGLSEILND